MNIRNTTAETHANLTCDRRIELKPGHDLNAFETWLEEQLLELEERFAADVTPDSLRRSLRQGR